MSADGIKPEGRRDFTWPCSTRGVASGFRKANFDSAFKRSSLAPSWTVFNPGVSIAQLPDDIIDLIVGNLSHVRDFRSCSLLDHRWLPHAQSRLFKAFLCLMHRAPCTIYCKAKAQSLENIIKKSPHIAHYFRTLSIELNSEPIQLCAAGSVSFLLPRMTNLREIRLVCFGPQVLDWSTLATSHANLFLDCFRRSALCHLSIEPIANLPALVLDEVHFLISLRLHKTSLSPMAVEAKQNTSSPFHTTTSLLPLEDFHFQSHSSDAEGRTASLLLQRLAGPSVDTFARLRRLRFYVRSQEDGFLLSVLRDSASSLRDLVLDIESPTQGLGAAFQMLTCLESLVLTFYNITDFSHVPKDCSRLLRSLAKAVCPLSKFHLLLIPRLHSKSFLNAQESAWNELNFAILHWVSLGTLRQVNVGSIGLIQLRIAQPSHFLRQCLSGVDAAGILNVSSA
ncbi:hypothetical protein BDN72DRAFT_202280 [Pluteus cervinus]|uniref:Uncharacterized protein n=1 Tax=Pluteus cervinus TaxID=181527 RepID=A0ACD3B6V7_9AGAR|nr:hypothetical protein BDN72DRAFT_202280 [Pluteus cervinus]